MKIFVIGDTHFGHSMLSQSGSRPDGFEDIIIKNWNQVVKPEDMVIHLGDFSLGKYQDYSINKSIQQWRNLLVGRIILVRGNHDNNNCAWYMDNGFDFCADRFEMEYKGKDLTFTHIPIDVYGENSYNIHGHIHSSLRAEELKESLSTYDPYRNLNVAADLIELKPMLLDTVFKTYLND